MDHKHTPSQPVCILCESTSEAPKQFTKQNQEYLTSSSPVLPAEIVSAYGPGFVPFLFNQRDEAVEEENDKPVFKKPEFLTTPTMEPP